MLDYRCPRSNFCEAMSLVIGSGSDPPPLKGWNAPTTSHFSSAILSTFYFFNTTLLTNLFSIDLMSMEPEASKLKPDIFGCGSGPSDDFGG